MRKLYLCSLFSVLCLSSLFASGNKEEEPAPLNEEWILCITSFDQSQLSPARQLAGYALTRDMVDKMRSISYRLRISPEYAYYESYAWQQEIGMAAKALSNKQNERSQLLFRGEPDWRYRQDLKKIDVEINKLADDLAKKEEQKPLIEREPVFRLSVANRDGIYPSPPPPGGERRFCQSQKADAILTGTLREFHGRYLIQLRLFTLYTNSWVYEDDIIFSLEDSGVAVEEIAARLGAVLAGNRPAAIAVNADPPETQVLVNQHYAGRGTVPARDHPPGTVTIAAAAEGYTPEMVETELIAGELSEIAVTLNPLQYTDVLIDTQSGSSLSVYHGAMYMGESPLVLRLPQNQLQYVSVEKRNEQGKLVFSSPELPADSLDLSVKTKILPNTKQKRVENARKWYYWAWGGTWITGIAAWITYGMYTSQVSVLSQSQDPAFYDSTIKLYYISMGTMIAAGAAIGYEIFHIGRYMYTATENFTPITKEARRKR